MLYTNADKTQNINTTATDIRVGDNNLYVYIDIMGHYIYIYV